MSEKIIVIQAGLKGGSGKTSQLALLHFWYEFYLGITPRCFDLDSGGSFQSLVGAQWPHAQTTDSEGFSEANYTMQGVISAVLKDTENKVFLIDLPSSSVDKAHSTFSGIDWEDLSFEGVQVVLLGNLTANTESPMLWENWKELFQIGESGVKALPLCNEMNGQLAPKVLEYFDQEVLKYPVIENQAIIKIITQKKYCIAHLFLPFMTDMRKFVKAKTTTMQEARELKTKYTEERIDLFDGLPDFNFISARNIAKSLEEFYYDLLRSEASKCLIPQGVFPLSFTDQIKIFDNFLPWVSPLKKVERVGGAMNVYTPDEVEDALSFYSASLSDSPFSPALGCFPNIPKASSSISEEIL